MKIAIVGLSPSTHDLAPFDEDWEMWGLPKDEDWHKMDILFEMHDRDYLTSRGYGGSYWETCRQRKTYMQDYYEDIPTAARYPIGVVTDTVFYGFPRKWDQEDWYNSTVAYMLALAICLGADEIGLWGVDCADGGPHEYQRPCLEYLIGLAVGRGITVHIPEGPTALGKFNPGGFPYKNKYGFIDGDNDIRGTEDSDK